jgi:hypothetical protein
MHFLFFTNWSNKEHFTSMVGLEGNKIFNHQSLQLRNIGIRIQGVDDRQSLQIVIIIISYYV